MEVAQATVSFSRVKDGLSSADAYWVEPSQIKRGAPTGQFLPRGSFVIEGRRNYIKGIEIKASTRTFMVTFALCSCLWTYQCYKETIGTLFAIIAWGDGSEQRSKKN